MLIEKQIERLLAKLVRFETTLERMLFEKADEIPDVRQYQTKERLDAPPEDESLFSPCVPGTAWGGEAGTYCWFKGTYTVPANLSGKNLYLYPKTDGYEGFMWVDGRPYGNFASKIAINSHGNHYCNYLTNANAGQNLEIALEYYTYHHVIGCFPFDTDNLNSYEYPIGSFDICVKTQQISDFLFDLRTLNDFVRVSSKNSFRRADIINTLTEAHKILCYSPDDAEKDAFMAALEEVHPMLQEQLAKTNGGTSVGYCGLIGHSHMDTAWLWTVHETVKKCARTYSNQINLMEQYPEYKFVQSSAYHTDMIREHYPRLFEDIKTKISEGRYEPNGGVWVECDCNIVGGESMARQFIWGQRYTRKHFNYMSDSFWLPDTFGYSAAIPQIMKLSGIKYFLTTKMAWNDTNRFPYDTFYWKGLDGTRVLSHLNRTQASPVPSRVMEFVVDGPENDSIKEKTVSQMRLLSYGNGDGGGGPSFEEIEMSRRIKDFEGLPCTGHTTVSNFMQNLEKSLVSPTTYTGELYLELHRGTLTNKHDIKRNMRKAEVALHNLEYITVHKAVIQGAGASDKDIRSMTKTMLVNQFHDILPGTSIPEVHGQSISEMSGLLSEASQKTSALLADGQNQYITIVNTLSTDRSDVAYIDLPNGYCIDTNKWRQQKVIMTDGSEVTAITGGTIPAFGSVVLPLKKQEAAPAASSFRWNGKTLYTNHACVTFDERGFISSFVDTKTNRELCNTQGYALNTFLIAEDVPLLWDNWDVDADIEMKMRDTAKLLSREIVSNGAVEFRIRSKYQITEKSTITQDIIFYSHSAEVRFETVMDWQNDHRLLKVAFDTNIFADTARNEVQFGFVKRPATRSTDIEKAKFEVCNHKYTDLSEAHFGAALLNDCKYGISVEEGNMRLTLHKSGTRPDYNGDKGHHLCTYSFLPHDGGFRTDNVILPAYELNYPVISVLGSKPMESLVRMENDSSVLIETVKPCEETENGEKAFILRLYEAEGGYVNANLTIPCAQKAEITNLLEDVSEEVPVTSEHTVSLTFKPFEIKTVKISY